MDLNLDAAVKNRISVKEVAKIMNCSQQFIRIGLQREKLPFGTAIKLSSTWTYYINPYQFKEYIGHNDKR